MRNRVKIMKSVEVWGTILGGLTLVVFLIYVITTNVYAYMLVGKKVRIDGKTLTITSSETGSVILSDRRTISAWYAKDLLVEEINK